MKLFSVKQKESGADGVKAMQREFRRRMISLALVAVVAAFALAAYLSSAWFASNYEATASDMMVSCEVSPNLVIAGSEGDLADIMSSGDPFQVVYNNTLAKLRPATHDSGDTGTPYTGLKYVTNRMDVSETTGLGSNLQYSNISSANNPQRFYRDFTVYIASLNVPAELTGVKVILSSEGTLAYDYQRALSVDFYLGEVKASAYRGTLNLAGAGTELALIDGGYTVPVNTAGDPLVVVMRVYFDGELKKDGDSAYVYSGELDRAPVSIHVHFRGEE